MTKPYLGDGGFGEYVAVCEQVGQAKVPDALDVTTAGALGLAGTAAVDAVDAVSPQAGTVLISVATGGVGAIALLVTACRSRFSERPGRSTGSWSTASSPMRTG